MNTDTIQFTTSETLWTTAAAEVGRVWGAESNLLSCWDQEEAGDDGWT